MKFEEKEVDEEFNQKQQHDFDESNIVADDTDQKSAFIKI